MKKLLVSIAGVVVAMTLGATTASSDVVGPAAATGTINTTPGSMLVDGETITIGDGAGTTVTFEFDTNGSVTPGHQQVGFNTSDDASQIMNKVFTAVNASALRITASIGAYASVFLQNFDEGSAGNVPITTTVTTNRFSVTGMSGGLDAPSAVTLVRFSARPTRQ